MPRRAHESRSGSGGYYLDLFSGIGGLALAVQHRLRPALYCDIDPYCQRVLVARQADGAIASAPVFSDVRALTGSNIPRRRSVTAIVAGFPCQSLSSIGARAGLFEGESALFFQIMRLVDELPSVRELFLENVPNLVSMCLDVVLAEIGRRGFDARWALASAADQGAPHLRRRWFLVAHKRSTLLVESRQHTNFMPTNVRWKSEPVPRIAVRPEFGQDRNYDRYWRQRQAAMGNAVVPCVARFAYDTLSAELHHILHDGSLKPIQGAIGLNSGVLLGGALYKAQGIEFVHGRTQVQTQMVVLATGQTFPRFATPRSRFFYGLAAFSRHTHKDWLHHIKCSRESVAYAQQWAGLGNTCVAFYSKTIVNPEWLEWMMGFPRGWTKIQD
jgi:DNA (cytosine-5)-methyltransferase 1